MKEFKIVNAEPSNYSPKAKAILESFAEVVEGPFSELELYRELENADCVIVRLGYRLDEHFLKRFSRLQAVATATTGLNHVDVGVAKEEGTAVLCLRGETEFLSQITATAEHTWALLLSLLRHIPSASVHVRQGAWDRSLFLGRELSGMTIGIIGYGRLGSIVAEYAQVFRMKVIAYDVSPCAKGLVDFVELNALLELSDVVSVHVALSESSRNLLGEEEFMRMKPGAFLINTARGEIVDETALLKALATKRLAGAAVDVLCDETSTSGSQSGQMVEYAKTHDNLLITPHIGGATHDSMWKTEVFMAKKIRAFFAGEEVLLV